MSFGRREGGPPPPKLDPVIERLKEREANRRDAVRMRRLKTAEIIYGKGRHVVNCTLRDESETGARVRLGAWFACPEDVTLRMSDGTAFESRVVWARDLDLGLRFKAADQDNTPATDENHVALARTVDLISALERQSPEAVVEALKSRQYLGDPDVAAASQALDGAYRALIVALRNTNRDEVDGDPDP